MAEGPILITGGSGQVGSAVACLARARGLDIWAPSRAELDLRDEMALTRTVRDGRWSAVINCAAYTAVDKAETEPVLAHAINARAPAILASATANAGIPILHVSTDYVFDGAKPTPYVETDPISPLNVYGVTKEAGEAAVRTSNPENHVVLRTAWVLSATGANFLNTMLRLGSERSEIRVVDDQFGSPSSAEEIAVALLTALSRREGRAGTWHFVNGGGASWHDLAAYIFAETARRAMPTPRLLAIPTSAYPTAAKRPVNSRLATDAFTRDFGITPKAWPEAVDSILATRLG